MLLVGGVLGHVSAQEPAPPQTPPAVAQVPATSIAEGYVWAEACKACHGAIYDAWHETKHARTIARLSAEEKETACIGCHVTGPKQMVVEDSKHVNVYVQCESCHGAGKAHIEAATGGAAKPGGVVRSPAQRLCESCHNDKSPHYRGFFYSALKGLVHKVPK
jgi:RecJ-like exonuclease